MPTKSLFALVPLLLLAVSCGEQITTRRGRQVFPYSYANSVIPVPKQFSSCSSGGTSYLDSFLNLHLFINGRSSESIHDFGPFLHGTNLKKENVITKTLYGEKTEYFKVGERYQVIKHKKPQAVFVCPGNKISMGTVESAALNSAWFINKTHHRFATIAPDIKITPVTVKIAPLIMNTSLLNQNGSLKKEALYMTDNALYSPLTESITFLPHSSLLLRGGSRLNLWEVPMVSAHEYGHHLFQMVYKEDFSGLTGTKSCFGKSHPHSSGQKNRNGRKVQIRHVLNAYNEGFADLISYYTLDQFERQVTGIRCLEKSRDVASPVFYDGKPKNFSKEALQSFFSTFEIPSHACEIPNFQEPHILGAIFAHSFDLFLSEMTNSDDEKLAALVEWVKFLRFEKRNFYLASPETFLKGTFSELLRMSVKRFNRTFDENICRMVEEIYPNLNLTECTN